MSAIATTALCSSVNVGWDPGGRGISPKITKTCERPRKKGRLSIPDKRPAIVDLPILSYTT
jgi:hypothetical protein